MRPSTAVAFVLSAGMVHGAQDKRGDPGGEFTVPQLEWLPDHHKNTNNFGIKFIRQRDTIW